ncbi:MAG: hypothetical protein KDA99_22385, partial [Planctomycetales bacterium]|nr:hypothetical protein [Planctomycetales bacterium]
MATDYVLNDYVLHAPILFADLGDWIRVIIFIVFIVAPIVTQVMKGANKQAGGGNRAGGPGGPGG